MSALLTRGGPHTPARGLCAHDLSPSERERTPPHLRSPAERVLRALYDAYPGEGDWLARAPLLHTTTSPHPCSAHVKEDNISSRKRQVRSHYPGVFRLQIAEELLPRAYLRSICQFPVPVHIWVDAAGHNGEGFAGP